jgi:glycosyltransferase involved in cell wall biosynthesis
MPRVLVLCEYPTLNGGERSLLSVLPTIEAAGWTIDVCCPPAGALSDALTAIGAEVIPAPAEANDGRRRDERLLEAIAKRLQTKRYDLVHANSLALSITTGRVAEDFGVPTIGHLRDIARLSGPKIAGLNGHTRLLAVSAATRDHHVAQGLDAGRTHVLHNGVDLEVFRPAPSAAGPSEIGPSNIRREFGIPTGAPVIGIVGQVILRKGQDIALSAAAEVLRRHADVHVLVIGTRHSDKPETVEFEKNLHRRCEAAGVAERVHFAGTRTDMPEAYRELSVLLHTARQEPLGRVLLEAAASGVPVVATEVGGTREIFPGGEADGAILVPVDDIPAAAGAIDKLLADADVRRRLGVAGRARIAAAFTAQQSTEGLLRHYHEVAAIPKPEAGRSVI